MDEKGKVYIQTDAEGNIIRCDGGYTTPEDLTGWIYIDEGYGDRYNLCQSHYFEAGLHTMDGIPLYCWDGESVRQRTDDEIETERLSIPAPPPSELEQLRADVDYIAIMGGVEL